MTSSPTVAGYITSCLRANLSADSLALRHLCTISDGRTHTETQTGSRHTRFMRTFTIEHQFFSSKGEVVNSQRREILPEPHKHNTHTQFVSPITSHFYNVLNHKGSECVSTLSSNRVI